MDASDWYVKHAKVFLEGRGYVVIPKEQVEVLHIRYEVHLHDLAMGKVSPERFEDMVLGTHARALASEMQERGVLALKRTDDVGTLSTYFDTSIAVIKPKDE
uniref:Uncharacterized protein n=1 Tax=Rhodopseudomonas palustris (strain DX-1) TaxID=652103 RepID=E6VL60_RHOPX